MSKKKWLSLFLAGAMLIGCLAGCGGGGGESTESPTGGDTPGTTESTAPVENDPVMELLGNKGEGLVVGLTVSDLASTYIVSAAEYTQKLLEAAGAEVHLVNCESNASTQSSQIDDFITMGCDVIMIHAADSEALAPAVQRANDAGIPCIGFNKEITGADLAFTVVSSDNVATGASAAQWLADKAKELGVENPKIAVMQGTLTQSDAYLRQDGIEEVAAAEGLMLINNPCDWASDQAESALSDTLTANPDLFGIITHCDSMDPGVISALRQAGKDGAAGEDNHIWWSGIDCDPVGVEALNTGLMDVCVEQSPLTLATVIVKGVLEYVINGEDLGGQVIPMETRVVTGEETSDPNLWALYDMDSDEFWVNTVNAWNSYLN